MASAPTGRQKRPDQPRHDRRQSGPVCSKAEGSGYETPSELTEEPQLHRRGSIVLGLGERAVETSEAERDRGMRPSVRKIKTIQMMKIVTTSERPRILVADRTRDAERPGICNDTCRDYI